MSENLHGPVGLLVWPHAVLVEVLPGAFLLLALALAADPDPVKEIEQQYGQAAAGGQAEAPRPESGKENGAAVGPAPRRRQSRSPRSRSPRARRSAGRCRREPSLRRCRSGRSASRGMIESGRARAVLS